MYIDTQYTRLYQAITHVYTFVASFLRFSKSERLSMGSFSCSTAGNIAKTASGCA